MGSDTTRDEIVVDEGTGTQGDAFGMYLDGQPYAYGFGDMAVGELVDETCIDCETLDHLAKYEFACVDTDAEGDCVAYDYVLEAGDGSLVSFESFESKDGEAFEPVSATFGTGFCSVWAVVKAGREIEVKELIAEDGSVTAEYVAPYAISFVELYCTEAAAQAAADAFAGGKGGRD